MTKCLKKKSASACAGEKTTTARRKDENRAWRQWQAFGRLARQQRERGEREVHKFCVALKRLERKDGEVRGRIADMDVSVTRRTGALAVCVVMPCDGNLCARLRKLVQPVWEANERGAL